MSQDLTLSACVTGAWRDAAGAVRNRPGLFVLLFLAWAVVNYFLLASQPALHATLAAARQPASAAAASAVAVSHAPLSSTLQRFGAMAAQWCVLLVIATQVMRYSLLGPESSRAQALFDRPFFRYAGLNILLAVLIALIVGIAALASVLVFRAVQSSNGGSTKALLFTVAVLLTCALLYLGARISLIFCDRATGAVTSWRALWKASQGHFWSIALTHVMAFLPSMGLALLIGVAAVGLARSGLLDGYALLVALAVLRSISTMISVCAAAGSSAWIYRRYNPGRSGLSRTPRPAATDINAPR